MSSYYTLKVTAINGVNSADKKTVNVPYADSDVTVSKVQQFINAYNTASDASYNLQKVVLLDPQKETVLWPNT